QSPGGDEVVGFPWLFDVFHHASRGAGNQDVRALSLFPIGGTAGLPIVRYRSDPDRTSAHLFPLFWHERDRARDATTTVAFPLFWRFHDKEADTLLALPLYGHHEDAAGATPSFLGPLYVYSREGEGARAKVMHAPLWPLGAYERGPDRTHVRALP